MQVRVPWKEKIRALYEIISKQHKETVILKSKEIYDKMIVELLNVGLWIEAVVESKSRDNVVYDVFIDLIHDVYMCTCNSWVYKRYELVIPENYQHLFKKPTIVVCPHIIKVLEYVYRKYVRD